LGGGLKLKKKTTHFPSKNTHGALGKGGGKSLDKGLSISAKEITVLEVGIPLKRRLGFNCGEMMGKVPRTRRGGDLGKKIVFRRKHQSSAKKGEKDGGKTVTPEKGGEKVFTRGGGKAS